MRDFPIGELSKAAGVKIPTIRFYEQIGLLPLARRTDANRRVYGDDEVRRLRFIRHCRELGFEVEDIRTLLDLASRPDQPCSDVDAIARRHIEKIRHRIAQLTSLKVELERMVAQGAHGIVADCHVIESLDDHDLCVHHHRVGEASSGPID